ncbi:MAG TPA: alternative ribosome rescue aminoacyl-tRNA hydrolase ArfB [Cytophagaceae bacterium]|jgi:ribosome-associated protein|nr:alternative ribosome rescue aminoacyl-tRNA hydrolase ArfB [Cytophagaceae bacterium]
MKEYHKLSFWKTLGIMEEVRFKASLSGGKGGQHVNKSSTKVELYWTPAKSTMLDEEAKQKIIHHLSKELSNKGELRLVCQEDRSQLKNKEKAIGKFYKLLISCFKIIKPRKATKPSKTSVTKRLESKTKRKAVKKDRKKPEE